MSYQINLPQIRQSQELSPLTLAELQTDQAYLKTNPELSLEEAATHIARKPIFKAVFKKSIDNDLYLQYREEIRKLRQKYLPFRSVDYIRQGLKQGKPSYFYPETLRKYVPVDSAQRKEALNKLETEFLEMCRQKPEAASLASRITCLHGTNSSLLALLPFTDYTMRPTGSLLNRGIAPMSGEIFNAGTNKTGVSQTSISMDMIEGISRCWDYAAHISHSFIPPKNLAESFKRLLEMMKGLSTEDDSYD